MIMATKKKKPKVTRETLDKALVAAELVAGITPTKKDDAALALIRKVERMIDDGNKIRKQLPKKKKKKKTQKSKRKNRQRSGFVPNAGFQPVQVSPNLTTAEHSKIISTASQATIKPVIEVKRDVAAQVRAGGGVAISNRPTPKQFVSETEAVFVNDKSRTPQGLKMRPRPQNSGSFGRGASARPRKASKKEKDRSDPVTSRPSGNLRGL